MGKQVLGLCAACSIIGLITIYAASGAMGTTRLPISELREDMVGSTVEISGTVVDLREHRNGHVFLKVQDDSGGSITIPLFSDVRSGVGRVEILDRVEVKGELSAYKGELEIIPSSARDVKVQRSGITPLSELGEEYYGKLVKVEGKIDRINRLPGGQAILNLQDENAIAKIFLPKNVAGELNWLAEGVEVRVGGWYQLYEGEPEIKVVDRACLLPVGNDA
ncbi:MAG: OB-fold nucleic acid binding domain-containing protein [Candidatus Hadarchaeales archaeon]